MLQHKTTNCDRAAVAIHAKHLCKPLSNGMCFFQPPRDKSDYQNKRFVFMPCRRLAVCFTVVFLSVIHLKNTVSTNINVAAYSTPRKKAKGQEVKVFGEASYLPRLSNVTLTYKKSRTDRMGSRIQLPLAAWFVARYFKWNFCAAYDEMAFMFDFPQCFAGYDPYHLLEVGQAKEYVIPSSVDEPGVYFINQNSHTLWNTIDEHERLGKNQSILNHDAVKEWRQMVLEAPIASELEKRLWKSTKSIRIAAHVRRGDILPGVRNDVFTGDDQVIAQIEVSKYYVKQRLGDHVKIETHLFSEDYGAVNWTRYGNLVDEYHLAEKGQSNLDLNLRDWKHFIEADVMLVGGTFSQIPSLARPNPSNRTGIPLTMYWAKGKVIRKWSPWKYENSREVMTFILPDQKVTAYTNLRPVSDTNFTILPITSVVGNTYVLS